MISLEKHSIFALICSFVCFCGIEQACGNELESLLQEGEASSPVVAAARMRVDQALLKHEELAEFFDPSFFAGVGRAERSRSVPGSSGNFTYLTNDSIDVQLGAEMPVNPGAYITVGGAKRILEDSTGYDELYQTMYGVQVRVPLLKDRGFKSFTLNKALAMSEYNAAVSSLLNAGQVLRRDIELAYINAYEKLSAYCVAQEATKRFQGLYKEAQELSRLKTIPEYQIFQSKLELQIGCEDEEKAKIDFDLCLVELARVIGVERQIVLAGNQNSLLEAGALLKELERVSVEDACEARGTYLELKNNIEYARTQIAISEEERLDRLDLEFGITAQGEHRTNPFGMDEIVTDRRMGTEINLIWRRSIDNRGPRTRIARYQLHIKELEESQREQRLAISAGMLDAERKFDGAMKRLRMVEEGIEAAKNTVAAEQERFRLGESTSSNVTDAQKNLTAILQRQVTATADLLRARANYQFASGYFHKVEEKSEE